LSDTKPGPPALSEDGLPPLREIIAEYQLSARKGLGQNFIFDLNVTRRIARTAGPIEGGTVYEVGPGPGGLTRALFSEGATRVIAVERDARCLPALEQIDSLKPGRLDVVNDDAMAVDEAALLTARGAELPVPVIANLPFNVGTALLIKWLSVEPWMPWWSRLTLMFQREVADRIVAKPGSDAYGRLSVIGQWRTQPRILFDVPRQVFVPPPNVDSAVLQMTPLENPRFPARLADLEAITAAGFGQRRKMLRKSLKSLSSKADEIIEKAGVNGQARAEELSLEQFCALARAYRELGK
jgi:16S rRNA (adenine1518-N6/adenine1519-N6)-dimethyltransferase